MTLQEFWNSRGGLGPIAGTQDLIAKELEVEAICHFARDGMHILDMGCGNGITAIELARRYDVVVEGVDFSDEMIRSARELTPDKGLKGSAVFDAGDVTCMDRPISTYDMVITERTLVNLKNWATQEKAIRDLTALLVPGGCYIMCENSLQGLDELNDLRALVDLPAIVPPWHNRYLDSLNVEGVSIPGVEIELQWFYASTYYLLSRIVNARLAADASAPPDYDSPINRLALKLPNIGTLGQGRIWKWRKRRNLERIVAAGHPLQQVAYVP